MRGRLAISLLIADVGRLSSTAISVTDFRSVQYRFSMMTRSLYVMRLKERDWGRFFFRFFILPDASVSNQGVAIIS